MLTLHHLGRSQSERIVWLCEELGLTYDLKCYTRDPVTLLAPPEYKALHPLGAAPVITDDGLLLAESAAIVEYIIAKHGGGRLALAPAHPDFAHYLYWFHFANGNLQSKMGRLSLLLRAGLAPESAAVNGMRAQLALVLGLLEARLGTVPYLAGQAFTAADIMTMFSLTTMRSFAPLDLAPYAQIRAYLHRLAAREAYQSAMRKGDPGMALLLD